MHGHLLLRRRMWALLQLHSKQCNQADCPVPRCKELRMLKRRQLIRQEEKRRQGYANMLQAQVGRPCSRQAATADAPASASPASSTTLLLPKHAA